MTIAKMYALRLVEYKRVVLVDVDSYIAKPLDLLFNVRLQPKQFVAGTLHECNNGHVITRPEYNDTLQLNDERFRWGLGLGSGVLAFNPSEEMHDDFYEFYSEHGLSVDHDQRLLYRLVLEGGWPLPIVMDLPFKVMVNNVCTCNPSHIIDSSVYSWAGNKPGEQRHTISAQMEKCPAFGGDNASFATCGCYMNVWCRWAADFVAFERFLEQQFRINNCSEVPRSFHWMTKSCGTTKETLLAPAQKHSSHAMRNGPGSNTLLFLIGTRPEAIKMAPIIHELFSRQLNVHVHLTGQHTSLLSRTFLESINLNRFITNRDWRETAVISPGQTVAAVLSSTLMQVEQVLQQAPSPAAVLVVGDTVTALAGAQAAYFRHVPIVHVEAGLRTHHIHLSNPEEYTRVSIAPIACIHFASSSKSRSTLLAEGVPENQICLTGNTNIDLALKTSQQSVHGIPAVDSVMKSAGGSFWILFTFHRRENFGHLPEVLQVIEVLLRGNAELRVLFPAHPNPAVQNAIAGLGTHHLTIIDPLTHVTTISSMLLPQEGSSLW